MDDDILDDIWKDAQSLLLRNESNAQLKSKDLDRKLSQVCALLPKIDIKNDDDYDVNIIWLCEENHPTNESIDGINIKIFYSNEEVRDVIREIETSNVLLIIDRMLVDDILQLLKDSSQILCLYILTNNENKHKIVMKEFPNIIYKIFDDKNELFCSISDDMKVCTSDLISTTIFDLIIEEETTNQTKNISSVWYRLLIESLLSSTEYKKAAKDDLIKYCREQYSINDDKQHSIDEFETEYSSTNAIRWFTKDSFLYRLFNKTMRSQNIDQIFKFRFFLIDLQKQLEDNFNEEVLESISKVYRGQHMSRLELTKLQKSKGKCISINTYLSTSIVEEVATVFASGLSNVIFEIDVDFNVSIKNRRISPVSVQALSDFPDECEVIFPVGSIFKVNRVEKHDATWRIYLKLVNEDDHEELRNYVEKQCMRKFPSTVKFVYLLMQIGDFDKAEQIIQMLIEESEVPSDDLNMKYVYDFMGQIWYAREKYESALFWFQKALDSSQIRITYREVIYLHIGNVHYKREKYKKALKYYNEALNHKETIDLFDLASLYEQFGNVYRDMDNLDEALIYFHKALDIYRSHNFKDFNYASIYSSIGSICFKRGDYQQALGFYKHVLNIQSRLLPKNHSELIFPYFNVGKSYAECANVEFAIIYLEKALNITIEISKSEYSNKSINPTINALLCVCLGNLYGCYGNESKALHFINKARQMYDGLDFTVQNDRSLVRNINDSFTNAYWNIGDFSSALNQMKRSLDLSKKPRDRIAQLTNIANICRIQHDSKGALNSLQSLLKLTSKLNSTMIDSQLLASVTHTIASVYKDRNDPEKAMNLAEAELRLRLNESNPNFKAIVATYQMIARLCPHRKVTYEKKAIDIMTEKLLPMNTDKASCHESIASTFSEINDYPQALFHYYTALDYMLRATSPDYTKLIGLYHQIYTAQCTIEPLDLNAALFYAEAGEAICSHVINMPQLPAYQRQILKFLDGHDSQTAYQSGFLMRYIIWIYSNLRLIYHRQGDYEQALKYCRKQEESLNRYTGENELMEFGEHYSQMGHAFESIEKFDDAIFYMEKSLERTIQDNNKCGWRYACIGNYYYKKKEYTMAISKLKIALTFYHNALSINHEFLSVAYSTLVCSYSSVNNYEHAFIYTKQCIKHTLRDNPIDHKSIGQQYALCGLFVYFYKPWDPREALKYYFKGIKHCEHLFPDSELDDLYFMFGFLNLRLEKYANALNYFHKAMKLLANTNRLYQWIELIFTEAGDFDNAYKYAKSRLNNHLKTKIDYHNLADAYFEMGVVYFKLGRYKLAMKVYKRSYDIQKIFPFDKAGENLYMIYNNIGHIYYEYGQLNEALNYCQEALSLYFLEESCDNRLSSIYVNLGLIECKLDHYYVALDYFGKAFELIYNKETNFHRAHRILFNHIGYVYFKLGQIETAMNNYQKSLSLYSKHHPNHPDLAQVYKNMGLIYEQVEHNYPLALSCYERALELVHNVKHPHYILYKSMIFTLLSKQ